jgi:beta-glucosidase/6-phospho-beta-glucosidase/beta-galactosidase
MELELDLDFKQAFNPDRFFFGVANAPYLCEGGYNTPEGIKNSYGALEASGQFERSGDAVRYWTDYAEQIKLAADLGLNAFRMGLEWARVQPTTSLEPHAPPAWDEAAVEHYADIVATLLGHKMQPIITLHHFTHPAWLGPGLWQDEAQVRLLGDFQLRIVEEVNDRLQTRGAGLMRHFLVYNEANLVPLIYHFQGLMAAEQGPAAIARAYDNMFVNYVRVYDGLVDLFARKGWGAPHIGTTIATLSAYEIDRMFLDVLRLRAWGVTRERADEHLRACRETYTARVNALARSKLTDAQYARYQRLVAVSAATVDLGSAFKRTFDALYASPRARKLDYLSANVYEPFGAAKGDDAFGDQPLWWEYAADGEVYRSYIHLYNERNDQRLPLYMGENTLSYKQPIGAPAEPRPDGWTRERYFKTYFMEIVRAVKAGVPIAGYLYWSIVDDYEWDAGYAPRLGLYNYDYVNHRILPTDGLGEPAGPIYAHLIAALRSGDKEQVGRAFTRAYGQK